MCLWWCFQLFCLARQEDFRRKDKYKESEKVAGVRGEGEGGREGGGRRRDGINWGYGRKGGKVKGKEREQEAV